MARADLNRRASWCCALLLFTLVAGPATAALCNVPSASHPTVAAAVRDGACTTVQLGAGAWPENLEVARDLVIAGAGSGASIVAGTLAMAGAGTDVTLSGLTIDGAAASVAGCWPSALLATGGARFDSSDDVVVTNSGIPNGGCRLFADGFESGGTLAWSLRQP